MLDSQSEHKTGEELLQPIWVETYSGSRYEFPDLTRPNITKIHKDLETGVSSNVVFGNVSFAVMMIPRHIIKRVGSGTHAFWVAP
jgi:hypothetical protein